MFYLVFHHILLFSLLSGQHFDHLEFNNVVNGTWFHLVQSAICNLQSAIYNLLPFYLVQSVQFLFMKTHWVLNRLSKFANVRYRKNQVFLWFTINSQSKLKKFSTLFLRYLPRKLATKFNKVSWWALWIADPRNFGSTVECCP